jgi:hypothetical protein
MKYLVELTKELLADLIDTRMRHREARERLRRNRERRVNLNATLAEQVSLLRNHRKEQLRLRHSVSTFCQAAVVRGGVVMPWRNPVSYPLETGSVLRNAPQESGVYALRHGKTWLYIGESKDILAQLVQHLGGNNLCIEKFANLTFSYELAAPTVRAWRMNELIREFRPVCQPMFD